MKKRKENGWNLTIRGKIVAYYELTTSVKDKSELPFQDLSTRIL